MKIAHAATLFTFMAKKLEFNKKWHAEKFWQTCGVLVMSFLVTQLMYWHLRHMPSVILANIGSGNGLLPGGTVPLPELMLTYILVNFKK